MPGIVINNLPDIATGFGTYSIVNIFPQAGGGPVQQLPLPLGVQGTNTQPSFLPVTFNGHTRLFVVGAATDNIQYDENYRALRQGILPPTFAPTLAAGALGRITGACIGYTAFWDNIGQRLSPLSAGSAVFNAANQSRAWSNIPTIAPDDQWNNVSGTTTANSATSIVGVGTRFTKEMLVGDRISLSSSNTTFATILTITDDTHLTVNAVLGNGTTQNFATIWRNSGVTHVKLFVSVDGGIPRLAAMVDLGISTYDENTATLALSDAQPNPIPVKFPRCTANAYYHARQFMIGDAEYPNRIYYSVTNDPEDNESFLETRDGLAAIALFVCRDQLFVGTAASIQRIQGYTTADFTVDIVEPQIGVLNHLSIRLIHGYAFVPSQLGIYLCTGSSFNLLSGLYERSWGQDVATNLQAYQQSFAIDQRDDNVYKLFVPIGQNAGTTTLSIPPIPQTPNTIVWVLDYSTMIPEAGGTMNPPEVMFDVYNRQIISAWTMGVPGSTRKDVFVGTTGNLYKQHASIDSTDTSLDAGDLYLKRLWMKTCAYSFSEYGGDEVDGKTLTGFVTWVQSPQDEWHLEIRCGDENCENNLNPDWTGGTSSPLIIQASNTESDYKDTSENILVTKSRRNFSPGQVAGALFQAWIYVDNPHYGWYFRGIRWLFRQEGSNYRRVQTMAGPPPE